MPSHLSPSIDRPRDVWLDARSLGTGADEFLSHVNGDRSFTVLVSPTQLPLRAASGRLRLAVEFVRDQPIPEGILPDVVLCHGVAELEAARDLPGARALYCVIANEDDLARAGAALATHYIQYGITELRDETNIPLELLIAWLQKSPVRILKAVAGAVEAEVAMATLEYGADGVLMSPTGPQAFARVLGLAEAAPQPPLTLTEWEVERVEHVGVGVRACVDVVSLLQPSEGLLVGSTCRAFALMCSETHPLPYMPLRPFRVNAGAIHSYVVAPGNRTRYLSELCVGASCLAVDTSGRSRVVRVGRAKIERRPLLLIEFGDGDTRGNIIVQDDWHVRITGAAGEVLNVTHCRPGTKLVGWRATEARHCGHAVEEALEER